MKYTVAAFLILASAVTTAAIAQNGAGQGPPKRYVVVVMPGMPLPTPTPSRGPLQKFFQPGSELASMTK
jgi:hypothetical protein